MKEPDVTNLEPCTVAEFKRAMVPGTTVNIENTVRPELSRQTTVQRVNTVDCVFQHPDPNDQRGSYLRWPKKDGVAKDGDTFVLTGSMSGLRITPVQDG